MSSNALVIVLAVIFFGLYYFVTVAQSEPSSWRLKSFFLGGANIGPELTEHSTLGITFAWSGGTWFFAWFGYQYGPIFIIYQMYWVISVIGIALLLPRIIRKIKNKTLHGFLGDHYGVKTQGVAAIATTIGYVINMGFELFWSALLFTSCIGYSELALPIACIMAITVGVYCSIGGYRSNAHTDKSQNILSVIGLGLVVFLVSTDINLPSNYMFAVNVFSGGCALYVLISVLHGFVNKKLPHWLLNFIPIVLVGISFYVSYVLLQESSSFANVLSHNTFDNKGATLDFFIGGAPLVFFIGMITFQLFFNMVDMQNWQQIAANSEMEDNVISDLQWSVIRGALYLFWFPALGGILLGCALRFVSGNPGIGANGEGIFTVAFQHVIPNAMEFIRAGVIGIILLGFISSTLSTVDSLLMSKVQTIFYDLIWRGRILKVISQNEENINEEHSIVLGARIWIIPLSLLSVFVFYGMNTFYSGQVGYFQSLMYALPLSLFAPIIYALFYPKNADKFIGKYVFAGILISIVIVTFMFIIASLDGSVYDIKIYFPMFSSYNLKDWLPALAPIVSNIISCFVLLLAIIMKKIGYNKVCDP